MGKRSGVKITKTVVDGLQPGEKVSDAEIIGFQVRCQAKSKVYLFAYRWNGQQRQVTIGTHGSPWTPQTARDRAKQLAGDVANGRDPASEKADQKTAPTVKEVCERFLTEHAEAKRKTRTADEYRRLVDKIIVPALGSKKVVDVARQDVAKLHHNMRETPYQANRVLAVLSKLFNLCEAWGLRPDRSNPCYHVEKFKEEKRERWLSAEEYGRLGEALSDAEAKWERARVIDDQIRELKQAGQDKGEGMAALKREREELGDLASPYATAAIRLLVFTGARMREVLGLRWEWVDLERGVARLSDSKTGAKNISLPLPAVDVLKALPRVEGNPFVIVGKNEGAALVNLHDPWEVVRDAAKLENVRIHDLRHGFASVAATSGVSLPIIGKMLGHSQPQTTARYAHLAPDPVKAVADATAGKIASAMGGAAQ